MLLNYINIVLNNVFTVFDYINKNTLLLKVLIIPSFRLCLSE